MSDVSSRVWLLDSWGGRALLAVWAAWRGFHRDQRCLLCDRGPSRAICLDCERAAIKRARESA